MSKARNHGGTVVSIWERDKRRCWICRHGVALPDASRDHVRPRGLGGYDKARNYRCAHRQCNAARGRLSEAVVQRVQASLPPGAKMQQVCDALRAEHRKERTG